WTGLGAGGGEQTGREDLRIDDQERATGPHAVGIIGRLRRHHDDERQRAEADEAAARFHGADKGCVSARPWREHNTHALRRIARRKTDARYEQKACKRKNRKRRRVKRASET